MGTPQSLIQASRDLILQPDRTALRVNPTNNAVISPTAKVDPNSIIDGGSFVDEGAIIGAEAIVRGSIISPGVIIEPRVVIIDSFIAPNTRVVSGSSLSNEIFGY